MRAFLKLVLITGLIATPFAGFAQSVDESESESGTEVVYFAEAGIDRQVLIGQELTFDARDSLVPEDQSVIYNWSFDDGAIAEGQKVSHAYRQRGNYTVTLTVFTSTETLRDTHSVTVFSREAILLTDGATTEEEVSEIRRDAEREDNLLLVLEDKSGDTDIIREETLARLLAESVEDIRRADIIIDYTGGGTGLNALLKFAQTFTGLDDLGMEEKAIISLAEPFTVSARIAQSTFDVLRPQFILLTNETALDAVFRASSPDELVNQVQQTGTELRLIGTFSERAIKQLTPLNFMSFIVNFMINKGVPVNTIVLILMMPVIATIFALARQVVGLRAFGIYIPTIVTLSFLALGLTYGLTVFIVVLATGSLIRIVLRKARLNYIPRLALVLTTVTFAIMALLSFGALANQKTVVALAVFPILIMMALAEQFVSAQIEQGFGAAALLTFETLVLAVATYYLVSWDPFKTLILAYPELIFLTIIINVLLGRWTGLRLIELYRFRQVKRFAKLP